MKTRRRLRPETTAGFALIEALVALALLLLAAVAVSGMVTSVSRAARGAAFEGRRSAAATRAVDRVRSGLAPDDSGSFTIVDGGDSFEVRFIRRDSVSPGALEISVRPSRGGGTLVFEAAAPAP